MFDRISKNQETLYLIFFIMMGVAKNDAFPLPKILTVAFIAIGAVSWMIKIALDRCSTTERLYQLLLLGLGMVSVYYNHHMGQLLAIMVVVGLKNVRIRRVLIVVMGMQAVVLIVNGIIFISALLVEGGFNGYYETRRIMGVWDVSKQYRIFFGNLHPNGTQKALCIFSVLLVYLNRVEERPATIAGLTLLNLIFFFITFSNTGLMLWILFVVVMLLLKRQKKWMDYFGRLSPALFILMVVGVIGISYLYSPDNLITRIVNLCVTGRIKLSHEYIMAMGFSVWGKPLSTDVAFSSLDCGYVNLLLCYGTVTLIMYCAGVFCVMRDMGNKKMYRELVLLWLFQLFFLIESFILVTWSNITFLYMGILLYESLGVKKDSFHIFNKLPDIKKR